MHLIHPLDNTTTTFDSETCDQATTALEAGCVVYLPKLAFALTDKERGLLSPDLVQSGSKNISYRPDNHTVKGMPSDSPYEVDVVALMQRFVDFSTDLVNSLFPTYVDHYELAKTSLRPVEISGRASSYRKDDTRLHVDAFPSNPNNGKRILRVFSNINPNNQARHWRLGEPFEGVANRFLPKIAKPFPGKHRLLNTLGVTKRPRTDYDHYMLNMHNRMKADETYQKAVEQAEFYFPPNTTWIVFTDLVSHAAMGGQYVLEQTIDLPVAGMKHPEYAPLTVLEGMLGRKLA
jgi:hypothetical protein